VELTERQELDAISKGVIGAAIDVHRVLGPGLLEVAYESCLAFELAERGYSVERQKPVPITYKGVEVEAGFRIDLLVDRKIIVELKAVDSIAPIHKAQLMTYLKLTGLKVGLLMNFNVNMLRQGLHRVVNKF
jgi:GxxExxY protein